MPRSTASSAAMSRHSSMGKLPIANQKSVFKAPLQLPSLGLNKYSNVEIKNDPRNPFTVQKNTEMLLIAHEHDREVREGYKPESTALRFWDRPNRAGVIREINSIKGHKESGFTLPGKRKQAFQELADGDSHAPKFNIFDKDDSRKMSRHESTGRLALTAPLLSETPMPDVLATPSERSQQSSIVANRALNYLKNSSEARKESVKDFVYNARSILTA